MTDCRKISHNKNHLIQNSMNGMILFIYAMMVLMFASHCSSMEMEANNNNYCSDALTCTKCIINTQCKWSLDKQVCIYMFQFNTSSLFVYKKEECPRVSVVTKHEYDDQFSNLEYTVKISNDVVGFMNFLRNSTFICNSSTINVYKKEIKSDEIVCSASIKLNYFEMHSKRSFTAFIYIKFNGVMLRFDNIADHYVTFFKHQCADEKKDEYCATCTWDDYGFAHYVRLCSSGNTCEGLNEIYMRHNSIGQSWDSTSQKVQDKCSEINVTAVDPLSGTLAGDTTITIVVKNHRIFADNREVTVTVAGTVCTNPRTSGSETITCTISPPSNVTYEAPSGPVLVKYSFQERELIVESSQTFRFYVGTTCGAPRPVLVGSRTLYGVMLGGTTVTLQGVHFVEPCVVSAARLFVILPNGSKLFASSYCDPPVYDTYMVCRSPRVNVDDWDSSVKGRLLNFGLDLMNFTGNQSLYVFGQSSKFKVNPDPVLVDFEIEKHGSVVVNGDHLQHIPPDNIQIGFQDLPSTGCVVTSVSERRFVCKPNKSIIAAQAMFVKIGDSLSYTVTTRHDYFILVVFLILVVVIVLCSVLAWYLRKKSRYSVLKTTCDSPVASRGLNTHSALLKR